jgi:hypothetical protein
MHPDDEAALMAKLLQDQSVLLIDGPRWTSPIPQTTRDISTIGSYCVIWNPNDLQQLPVDYIEAGNDWYCRGEYATIQLLRCKIVGAILTDGRLAIATRLEHAAAADVERRYKFLRRVIKTSYHNSVVRWSNPYLEAGKGGPGLLPVSWTFG